MKLDMSKLKKLSSDKHKTVLRHDDGHEIHLTHSKLPKEQLKALHKLPMMAEGGQVRDKGPAIDPKKAKEIQDGANQSGWQPDKWKKNLKEGLGLAKGGQVKRKDLEIEEIDPPEPKEHLDFEPIEDESDSKKEPLDYEEIKMADGGEVDKGKTININVGGAPQAEPQQAPQQIPPTAQMQPQQQDPRIPTPAPTMSEVTQSMPPDTQAASVQPASPTDQIKTGQSLDQNRAPTQVQAAPQQHSPNLYDSYETQKQALGDIGKEQSKLGQDQAKVFAQQAKSTNDLMQDFKQHSEQLHNERQALLDDIKANHIDPNRYMGSMDTGKRILTGIGLFLGGLGQGPNQALEFLNKQIDRDVDIQKAELGKKQSLLQANLHEYGNMRDAMSMTKLMLTDIASAGIQKAAAQSSSPQALARAQMLQGQLEADTAPKMQSMALNRMLMSGGQSSGEGGVPSEQYLNALRVIKPEMAKDIEGRMIPGVGLAKIPVPAEDRRTIVAKQTLDQQAKDFYDWAKKHSGSMSPEEINTGKTKAAELQSLYRNAINGGVFKKGEQEFIDTIIDSDPTKFFNNIRVLPKLKEVIDSNNKQLNTVKKGFGLPEGDGKPQLDARQQSFAKWAQSNINSKDAGIRQKAQLTLKKLGLE